MKITYTTMKTPLLSLLITMAWLTFTAAGSAADLKAQLEGVMQKVKAKVKAGTKAEADFTEELKAFDTLIVEHQAEKTDDVARISMMKAMIYAVCAKTDKAVELLDKVKADFPESSAAMEAEQIKLAMTAQSEGQKIQRTLTAGAHFPDFDEKDIDGQPCSIASFKGKLVLIDFWATWCGPCIAELPNLLKTYEKYHDKGFEIIGISLDQDRDKLTTFIKEKKMGWPQFFDGRGWQNKLASKYGVKSIPATYLLDKEGKVIAAGLRGDALEKAVGDALK